MHAIVLSYAGKKKSGVLFFPSEVAAAVNPHMYITGVPKQSSLMLA